MNYKEMRKIYLLIVVLFCALTSAFAQGEIAGKVVDEKGEGAYPVNVIIVDDAGVSTGVGAQTDFDGNYSLKPLEAGKYNIQVSALGYPKKILQGIRVSSDNTTFQDIKIEKTDKELGTVIVERPKAALIKKGETSIEKKITGDDIKSLPTRSVGDLAAKSTSAFQSDAGGAVSFKGTRTNGTGYYINGMKVFGNAVVPTDDIEELVVLTGGVPAQYGDATGGIISITTKKPSGKFGGSASVQTSYGLDPYGYLLANGTLRGPILQTKGKDKRTVISFSGAFEYLGRKDANPSAIGVWQVNPDKMNDIKANPLVKLTDGFVLNSENLTFKDLYKTPVKPFNGDKNFRGNLSFDISPVDGIMITLGGSANYRKYYDWVEEYTLLNAENNSSKTDLNYRAFLRFSHDIAATMKKKDGEAKESKSSYIKKVMYSFQVDFEKFKQTTEDATHGANVFNYGHIGNFKTLKAKSFTLDDTLTINGVTYKGIVQNGTSDTAVLFKPGTVNVLGTRFTEQYYQSLGGVQNQDGYYQVYGSNQVGYTQNVNQIEGQKGGLINGKRADIVYDIWHNIGRQFNGYTIDRNDEQYRGRFDFSFDIQKPGSPDLNRHSIKLGMEYEQRVQRRFSVNPLGLWDKARNLVNKQLELDRANATFLIGGKEYHAGDAELANFGTGLNGSAGLNKDSIIFAYKVVDTAQTTFDRNLRSQLGLSNNEWVDIFNINPDKLSLGLFSAEELLLPVGGSTLINARGYDYAGNVLNSNPTITDFFNAKDANGNFTRLQGAFRPTYAAGYIQDKFYYKDLGFLVGLRVDYYNTNQYVLKDPYNLYETNKKSDVTTINGNTVTHPDNIGNDYTVYVNDFQNPTQIIGYRDGDQWYNANGEALASAADLLNSSGKFVPYKKNPNDDVLSKNGFNPLNSFEKYKASWIFMPRLQLTFNVSDNAQFFAHYDVLSQRPGNTGTLRNASNLVDYLYWSQLTTVKNNPNLRPERTIDFEFGYKQKLSAFAVATIAAFYKEFRDMVQLKKYYAAYPKEYTTYANVDFGNSKGVTLGLDFTRFYGFKLDFNYTLMFAEGTGSDDQSQQFLINANSPNFRTVFPLDFDSRHTINTILDLRFGRSESKNEFMAIKNPVLAKILDDFGVNLSFKAYSGTPYTSQEKVTPEGTITGGGRSAPKGTINGVRKNWYFRGDLRVNKNFEIPTAKRKVGDGNGVKTSSLTNNKLSIGVFLLIENLFNTKNQISVYRFTGSTDDDGYLTDPSTQSAIAATNNPNAFRDLYKARINSPNNYSLPRRIYLGASLNF